MAKKSIYVPMVSPMDHKGNICLDSVGKLIHHLDESVTGFIPCLTSGEGWSLSDSNWETMLRAVCSYVDRDRVMVGIERPTTDEVLRLVDIANGVSPKTIVVTTPFGSDVSQKEMVTHYESIAVESDCELVIYNESALSKNTTSIDALLEISKLSNVVAIKDSPEFERSSEEIGHLRAGGLKYYLGWEKNLHQGIRNDGNIVSLSNLLPELCVEDASSFNLTLNNSVVEAVKEYALTSEEWYRSIKLNLYARGLISTPSLSS